MSTFRLSEENERWLREMSDHHDLSIAYLVNQTVSAAKKHCEEHGGRLHLPLDFSEKWTKRKKK